MPPPSRPRTSADEHTPRKECATPLDLTGASGSVDPPESDFTKLKHNRWRPSCYARRTSEQAGYIVKPSRSEVLKEAPPTGVEQVHGEIRPDGIVWHYQGPALSDSPAWTWDHLDLVNARARTMAVSEMDGTWGHASRQVLAGHDDTPRLVVYQDLVAGVLPSYGRATGGDEHDLVYWHFVASMDRLITGRRHATRSLAAAYHALGGKTPNPGPAGVLGLALTDFARNARTRLSALGSDLDLVEDGMLEQNERLSSSELASRLGQMRREAVVLRRALTPVDRALDESDEDLPAWFRSPEIDTAQSSIHGVLDDITALTERIRSLQDELTSRLADETNRQLYVVSIVTALVMPATFVTGFFGMNTGGLLWSGDETSMGTVYAGIACLLAVAIMLLVLRGKKLL